MSDYRPLTDIWLLGRPKYKYYGAYPCGFLQRARELLGVHPLDPVLHACSGMAREYSKPENGVRPGVPVRGFGVNDITLDIDPELHPDYCQDAREPFPLFRAAVSGGTELRAGWPAILIDPPYTERDAEEYRCGSEVFPDAGLLLENGLAAVRPGGRVGMLHYLLPKPPKDAHFVAAIGVLVGYGNRIRCFSVFERPC